MNESEIKSRIYSIVKNYIQKRDWINYDDFDLKLSDNIFKEFKHGNYNIDDIIRKQKTHFFKLNQITKDKFLRGGIGTTIYEFLVDVKIDTYIISEVTSITPIQIFTDDIESFNKIKAISKKEVEKLVPLYILEDDIKEYIKKIIGEHFEYKDWGGERSDLYTDLIFQGKRVSAAFMLKGRGLKGKLTIAKCGKNGDQLLRLVKEPARIFLIQHVNKVDSRVQELLRLLVKEQIQKRQEQLYYCIMDGTDTARLLMAYKKLVL